MIRCLCCGKPIKDPGAYESHVLWHEKCIRAFFGIKTMPELDISEKELEKLANLAVNRGITVPGVQKKLSLHLDSKDKTARLTIVDYPSGYILKPQSDSFAFLPEAEAMVMKMAEAARIRTVPNALMKIRDENAYITKRIDRAGGALYAMEDFCQLSGRLTEDKYRGSCESCAKIIQRYSKNTGLDTAEFYYRLLFCFLTGNSDMHLKNFSLIETEPKSRVYELSAAYDLLPVNLVMPEDREEFALTMNGKKSNIKKSDFLAFARSCKISNQAAVKMIDRILSFKEKFLSSINNSFLTEDEKSAFIELMNERFERVGE